MRRVGRCLCVDLQATTTEMAISYGRRTRTRRRLRRDLDKNGLAKVVEKKEVKETKTVSQNMQFVRLASYLQDGETPMQAIHRLGEQGKKKPKSNRRRMPYDEGSCIGFM